MANWREFINKDAASRYIEDLDRSAKNQSSDLENTWFRAYRYYLSTKYIDELAKAQAEVMGEIQAAQEKLDEAKRQMDKQLEVSSMDHEFIKRSHEGITQMQRAESEIRYALQTLAAIPPYEAPEWFVEFLKTVLFDEAPEIVQPEWRGQSPTRRSKLPWKKNK